MLTALMRATRPTSKGVAQGYDREAADKGPLLSLTGVSKTYDGETLAVQRLDLDVARGEFLTMLGPSGSGKTTSLMLIAGFEAPTTGEIILDGRSLANLPPHKRDIGVVFQNYALFPHMSVFENIAFPLSVRRTSAADIKARVTRALEMVRLRDFGTRKPNQISGGQQQRVALARALVFEPKLILMDEPLGALDRQLREEMQLEIRALHQRLGVTVIYVTHDQAEALTMSDKVAVFKDGVVQQLDSPRALYEYPCNAFVARFIGENNRLSGVVERVDADRCSIRLDEGQSVVALARDIGPVGTRATLSIRPERVGVIAAGSSVAAANGNRFRANLIEMIYLGDHLRARLSVPGCGEIMAKLPRSAVEIASDGGGEIVVQWADHDCLAFMPDSETSAAGVPGETRS